MKKILLSLCLFGFALNSNSLSMMEVARNNPSLTKDVVKVLYEHKEDVNSSDVIYNYLVKHKDDEIRDYKGAWMLSKISTFVVFNYVSEAKVKKRVALAEIGKSFAEQAIRISPKDIEGYYWHSANILYIISVRSSFYNFMHGYQFMKILRTAWEIDSSYRYQDLIYFACKTYIPSIFTGGSKEFELHLRSMEEKHPKEPMTLTWLGKYYISVKDYPNAQKYCSLAQNYMYKLKKGTTTYNYYRGLEDECLERSSMEDHEQIGI